MSEPVPTRIPAVRSWTTWRQMALTLLVSWYLMEVVHEAGHVLGAGGQVDAVHVPLIGFSHTDLADDADTVRSIGAGPVLGGLGPLVLLLLPRRRWYGRLGWFFSGWCLVANGAYLAAGALLADGDAGDLLARGVHAWVLVTAGLGGVAAGLGVWHGNGRWAGVIPDRSDRS